MTDHKDAQEGTETKKKRTPWRKRLLRWLVIFAVIYAVWMIIAYTMQERIIFPGATAWHALTRDTPEPSDAWTRWDLERDDGTQALAWFRKERLATSESPAPLAVFFHGNADVARDRMDMGTTYASMGCHTVLIEYPGYDDVEGAPGQKAIIRDALRAIERAVARDDVDADRVVYHGHSIGGGVAAQIAARRAPTLLVLESTFTSMTAMVNRYMVPSFMLRHPFQTDEVLPALDIPILIMHGDLDVIIFSSHAERNAAIARDATLEMFSGYGHDGCYLAPEYVRTVRDFLVNNDFIAD